MSIKPVTVRENSVFNEALQSVTDKDLSSHTRIKQIKRNHEQLANGRVWNSEKRKVTYNADSTEVADYYRENQSAILKTALSSILKTPTSEIEPLDIDEALQDKEKLAKIGNQLRLHFPY
jgi:hypothetical protein